MGDYFVEATKFWSRAPRSEGSLFPPNMFAPSLFPLFLLSLSSGPLQPTITATTGCACRQRPSLPLPCFACGASRTPCSAPLRRVQTRPELHRRRPWPHGAPRCRLELHRRGLWQLPDAPSPRIVATAWSSLAACLEARSLPRALLPP